MEDWLLLNWRIYICKYFKQFDHCVVRSPMLLGALRATNHFKTHFSLNPLIRSTFKLPLVFVILKEFSYRCLSSGDNFSICLGFEWYPKILHYILRYFTIPVLYNSEPKGTAPSQRSQLRVKEHGSKSKSIAPSQRAQFWGSSKLWITLIPI